MQAISQIICPNCGSPSAQRHHLLESQLTRTECQDCDYLSIVCQRTKRVIEAYSPGIDVGRFRQAMLKRQALAIGIG